MASIAKLVDDEEKKKMAEGGENREGYLQFIAVIIFYYLYNFCFQTIDSVFDLDVQSDINRHTKVSFFIKNVLTKNYRKNHIYPNINVKIS